MERATRFEELWVWQQARKAVAAAYLDFGADSPAARDFGFINQACRAAVSIMNNIAEGFERGSDPDFARFLSIAKASCGELRSMYYVAEDLHYLEASIANNRRSDLRQLSSGIESLRRHLRKT